MRQGTRNLFAAIAVIALATVLYSRPGEPVHVTLGGNAYELQDSSGFPMGYPSSPDQLGPIGGASDNLDVRLTLGPVEFSCRGAYLELAQDAHIVTSGRLFCPIESPEADLMTVREVIDTAGFWSERTDLTQSPRRAIAHGRDLEAAFRYLQETPRQGTVLRVPLYSWLGEGGLYLELNAARHRSAGSGPSYELVFSWRPACISDFLAERMTQPPVETNDAARASHMQRRAQEECPPL